MPHMSIIHCKVPGRTRFKIIGLQQAPRIKAFLEQTLAAQPHVETVKASVITGSLLITYNSNNTPQRIAGNIKAALAQWEQGTRPIERTVYQAPWPSANLSHPDIKEKPLAIDHWHRLERDEILRLLEVHRAKGLSMEDWQARLRQYGPNRLPQSASRSRWEMLIGQLNSLPVYLLAAAAGFSLMSGGFFEAVVILGVVAANAVIGFATESGAEKTIQALKALVRPIAEVIREGTSLLIPAEEVVPGDLLVLKPGYYVAADSRILVASHLTIDESMLTGESMPVVKAIEPLKTDLEVPLGERVNMAYMGTLVTGGEGIAAAVATGRFSEIGQLQILLNETRPPKTPIERQLEQLGDQIVLMCLVICGMVFVLGFLRGYGMVQMLRMAISLAAAAVPEGLPAAATINFALGINRMRKHHVLIRHLHAMETLGAVQTLCLDKTGTLTLNQMTVRRLYLGGEAFELAEGQFHGLHGSANAAERGDLRQLLATCVLCNETRIEIHEGCLRFNGSATETALVHLALNAGMDVLEFLNGFRLIGFDHRSENRLFMSSLHHADDDSRRLSVKGSPSEVLAMCGTYMVGDCVTPLTETVRNAIETENARMAGNALRVLGFAFRIANGDDESVDDQKLTWLGLAGLADPIRPQARDLIEVFHQAGVDTVMITGDQSATAYAVASELNLSGGRPVQILDSSELNHLDESSLQALAKNTHAYARVSPAHKLQIVRAIQAAGKTVAMTGDGINDGPALRAADIGIAMGRSGTDVARDVADIILEEDQLEILAAALADGRAIYDNIRKTVHFLLATNISEIMLIFAAMASGIGFPLNIMQLLWVNLISDILPGLALSQEALDPDILTRAPREAKAPLFSGSDFRTMIREAGAITGGALAAYGFGLARYGAGPAARTLAFQSLTVGQLLHAMSCRSEYRRSQGSAAMTPNPLLSMAVGGSLCLQALTLFVPPLRGFLGLSRIGLIDLAVIAGSAMTPFLMNETVKPTKERQSC